jgi:hypothetical protein
MSFQNGIDWDLVNVRSKYYLQAWGAWAAHGEEAKRLGCRSILAALSASASMPVEDVGASVDAVIRILPSDMVMLAVLLYQKRRLQKDICRELGISLASVEFSVRALKLAVFVGVEKNS